MKRIYIVGVECSVSESIKYGIAGHRIIVPETKNGKPSLELINFTRKEAREFFDEISDMEDVSAELVFNK